ncbi:hypothetical protein [Thermovenabulum gondwanense]|nr:hypothetical protein [Thermovenabulum gondwanense]
MNFKPGFLGHKGTPSESESGLSAIEASIGGEIFITRNIMMKVETA